MVRGYKCFYKGLINTIGVKFEVGKMYQVFGNIVFGGNGNGYHMCERLEDTLRFFDAFHDEIDICSVIGMGECIKSDDGYNDYYDMYVCEKMYIMKKLTREEIITYGLNLQEMRVTRFISSIKLTEEEKIRFRAKFKKQNYIIEFIDYYQDNIKDAFMRRYKK